MKKMLLIAAAALTLGSATAFADGGDWTAPNAAVLTQQEVNQNVATALAAQQQAGQPSAGHSYMFFSGSTNQGPSYNPTLGAGGNG